MSLIDVLYYRPLDGGAKSTSERRKEMTVGDVINEEDPDRGPG
jgi:hypothetical protein